MISLNKTFLSSQEYENRNWFIIDCKDQKIGRLATIITALLKGKFKPHYHPAIDVGDYIILVNAQSIIVNRDAKHYIVNKPGRPGRSLKIRNATSSLPKMTIERAIKGMLPQVEKKRLMRRLNIYNGLEHPHAAQNPVEIDLANLKFDNNMTK